MKGGTPPTVALIVAVAENGVIGRDNSLPWDLPGDLQYFKRTTLGKPIIMGRKTWEAIGRPLPGRSNIVISRQLAYDAPGASVVATLEQALALATGIAREADVNEIMVIGGAAIYAAALPVADKLYVTEVHAELEGDARLPAIDWTFWGESSRERYHAGKSNSYDYSFVVYDRK